MAYTFKNGLSSNQFVVKQQKMPLANSSNRALDPTEADSTQWMYAGGGAVVGAGAGYVIGKKRGNAKKGALLGLVAGGIGGFLAGHFIAQPA